MFWLPESNLDFFSFVFTTCSHLKSYYVSAVYQAVWPGWKMPFLLFQEMFNPWKKTPFTSLPAQSEQMSMSQGKQVYLEEGYLSLCVTKYVVFWLFWFVVVVVVVVVVVGYALSIMYTLHQYDATRLQGEQLFFLLQNSWGWGQEIRNLLTRSVFCSAKVIGSRSVFTNKELDNNSKNDKNRRKMVSNLPVSTCVPYITSPAPKILDFFIRFQ